MSQPTTLPPLCSIMYWIVPLDLGTEVNVGRGLRARLTHGKDPNLTIPTSNVCKKCARQNCKVNNNNNTYYYFYNNGKNVLDMVGGACASCASLNIHNKAASTASAAAA